MATTVAAQAGALTEGAGGRAFMSAVRAVGRARRASDGAFGVGASTGQAPVDFTSLDLAG
eukprot:2082611-Pleurochrysis_carterae.AAC.1